MGAGKHESAKLAQTKDPWVIPKSPSKPLSYWLDKVLQPQERGY
jgi:hypothetical protein